LISQYFSIPKKCKSGKQDVMFRRHSEKPEMLKLPISVNVKETYINKGID